MITSILFFDCLYLSLKKDSIILEFATLIFCETMLFRTDTSYEKYEYISYLTGGGEKQERHRIFPNPRYLFRKLFPPSGFRGHFGEEISNDLDNVDISIFMPPEAFVNSSILVQVFAHKPELEDQAKGFAYEFDTESQRRGFAALGTKIKQGTLLTFDLVMPYLFVKDSIQKLIWNGRTQSCQFEVTIPNNIQQNIIIGKLLISQHSVPIGEIRFKLKLKLAENERDTHIKNVDNIPCGEADRYTLAFISYASNDRPEVLRRVQMLSMVGIKYFQDVLNLDPGERWSKKLYSYVDNSDVLFLFWSSAAKNSEWVEREWQYGLQKYGEDFVKPIIIEGPPFPPPPPELAHLHFADKIMYFINDKFDNID